MSLIKMNAKEHDDEVRLILAELLMCGDMFFLIGWQRAVRTKNMLAVKRVSGFIIAVRNEPHTYASWRVTDAGKRFITNKENLP